MKQIGGFTLFEILFVLLLSALLLVGLTQLYLLIKSDFNFVEELSDLQSREQIASSMLESRIRMAGDANCVRENTINNQQAMIGFNHSTIPNKWRYQIKTGTDMILIGECLHYRNRNQFLKVAYYIANTHRRQKNGQWIYALFQKPLNGEREELVSGIVGLTILYGVSDGHGNVSEYLKASDITDWQRVITVQITLCLSVRDSPFYSKHYIGIDGIPKWVILIKLRLR